MEKQYRVRWEIDVWDETEKGAAFQAAGYAQKSAMSSVYAVQEHKDSRPIGVPEIIDLEIVLQEGEKQ